MSGNNRTGIEEIKGWRERCFRAEYELNLWKRRWKELKKVIRNGPLTLDDYEIEAKMDDIEERIR